MIKRIIFFITALVTIQAFSQRSSSSPYSIFGVGEEFGTRTVEQISMGSIGAAYSSNQYLNFINPASLSELRYATYVFGILNNGLRIKDADTNQSSTSTSLSYFSFGFPLNDKMGVVFGMQPTSAVGYSLVNTIEDTDGNIVDRTQFTGDGAVNRVYGGLGVKLFKGFSVGFEADFLFGNITNDVVNGRLDVALGTKNTEIANIRGASIKVGAQYKTQIKEDLNLHVGGSIKLSNTLRATGDEYLYSFTRGTFGSEIPRDTISATSLRGKLERPLETIVGIGLGKQNKWYAGVNYKVQDALLPTGYLDNSAQSFRYGNSSRISFGGFYLPKVNSISSYWERVTYRAGFRYEKTGLLVNGVPTGTTFTAIDDFGISFGLGLPLGNRISNVNVGFEYGKRGTQDNGLLQENYLNLRLSLSLNDIWFKKRKID
ncbi:hypothetical protein AAON49_02525 [Pseudotenacibaculum sp. MALMAid0570]|uniref:hypothetical protein n=1 Tax=Pseudotenacibaculum sp. MALMAid0570 TaxID=3143938 RepID=UPI0032DF95E0